MRVRQLIALSLCLVLLGSSAHAATPTPKPSSKPSPSKKATVKPTGKSTVKSDSTKKPVKKKATKKPTKKKKKVKKTATPIPSPSPIWPPVRFTSNKGIYAKIPTGKELVGLISAKRKLAADVVKCSTNACGAVIVAADYSCKWWEIKSTVSGNDPNDPSKKILLGTLRTTYGSLNPNTYANILLISDEPLFMPETLDPITLTPMPPIPRPGIVVGNISATCHKSSANEKIPTNTYLPIRR
ncbi:MAG: hypothetical protein ABR71_02990 [Actinobacteria bacterium BACL4 MAG-120820-bin23]|jgi:hypothetical protein|nr:MAG: hypothetical protein ABR71_02990 [Actinobacteria bacterium BACL4 MAG-120820-bin23]KRO92190.1 MAG: hypothetical protein ABS08_02870 [Actinobacteria bacterium BACL4 MAG-120507-bin0]